MDKTTTGMIFDIQRWSLHDGPGIRTNVFMKGCPLSCSWCSNPESQLNDREIVYFKDKCIHCQACLLACPQRAITAAGEGLNIDYAVCRACKSFDCTKSCYARALDIMGRQVTVAEVLDEVLSDKGIYDSSGGGLTVTGGEPFAQPDFLLALLREAKAAGLHIVIESCLHVPWKHMEACLPHIDFMFMDLKMLNEAGHRTHTGAGNRQILENMIRLHHAGGHRELVVRTPVIPGINDSLTEIGAIADWICCNLPRVRTYELLPYHRLGRGKYISMGKEYRLADLEAPDDDRMEQLREEVRKRGLKIK